MYVYDIWFITLDATWKPSSIRASPIRSRVCFVHKFLISNLIIYKNTYLFMLYDLRHRYEILLAPEGVARLISLNSIKRHVCEIFAVKELCLRNAASSSISVTLSHPLSTWISKSAAKPQFPAGHQAKNGPACTGIPTQSSAIIFNETSKYS